MQNKQKKKQKCRKHLWNSERDSQDLGRFPTASEGGRFALIIPDIRHGGEDAVFQRLGRHPADRQQALASFSVVIRLVNIPGHAKVCSTERKTGKQRLGKPLNIAYIRRGRGSSRTRAHPSHLLPPPLPPPSISVEKPALRATFADIQTLYVKKRKRKTPTNLRSSR